MSDNSNNIIIASDHAGFPLKQKVAKYLKDNGYSVQDEGCFSKDSVDYPDYALKVADAVSGGDYNTGILVCGTGIGMSITANKIAGIRASHCSTEKQSFFSRSHNNANVLCLGGRLLKAKTAYKIIDTWLSTPFECGRHDKRVNIIDRIIKK